ncbi:MAG: DUF4230 domain-containing protein [Bacteroidales bacterium]|nr:DUF4230 domain-containing protein [Bacteroidales bacterium]
MSALLNIILTVLLAGALVFVALRLKAKFSSSRKKELSIDKTPTSILAIERIAELTTASFFDEKVILTNKQNAVPENLDRVFFVDAKALAEPLTDDSICLIAKCVVKAGYDFSDFKKEDLRDENGILHMRLPKAKIIDKISNPTDWDYFSGSETMTPEQAHAVEEKAKAMFVKEAIDNGILTSAEEYGRKRIKMIFLSLGYKDVVFED